MHTVVVAIAVLNFGLVSAPIGEDVASLIDRLDSWSKNKAKKASDELAAMGENVVPELIEALSDKHRRKRRFAARTLREIGQEAADAIPALSRSLKDSDALTREYAAEALGKMANQADHLIPLLTTATEDSEQGVREQARVGIARLTEARRPQGQADSAQTRPAANESPSTIGRTKRTEEVDRPDQLSSTDSDVKNSAAALGSHSPVDGGVSGKQRLMALGRCAIFIFIIAGFFALLCVYREEPD